MQKAKKGKVVRREAKSGKLLARHFFQLAGSMRILSKQLVVASKYSYVLDDILSQNRLAPWPGPSRRS